MPFPKELILQHTTLKEEAPPITSMYHWYKREYEFGFSYTFEYFKRDKSDYDQFYDGVLEEDYDPKDACDREAEYGNGNAGIYW